MAKCQQEHHIFVVFCRLLFPFPSPQLHSNLRNRQPHNYVSCKISSLVATEEGRMSFDSPKALYPKKCYCLCHMEAPWKRAILPGLSLFYPAQSSDLWDTIRSPTYTCQESQKERNGRNRTERKSKGIMAKTKFD